MSFSTFPWQFSVVFGDGRREIPARWIPPTMPEIITGPQIVSLHTFSGVQLYQFTGNDLIDLSWSRDLCEVSRCRLNVSSTLDYNRFPDIMPWLHWVSVWDGSGEVLLWRGPIIKLEANKSTMTLECRDMAALFGRTRCPLEQRWDPTDPADIANELLAAMIEVHGLNVRPIVRRDPYGDRFDFAARADEVMLDSTIDDLVRLGLKWSVVAGTPILGPMPRTVVASLSENDFVGSGLSISRDGSNTFNDVLLRAADTLARSKVPMAGLNLQTIANVDSMFGPSNADRAVKQHARYVSKFHDTVVLPDDAVLHPNAPVTIDQLVPTSRIVIDAFGQMIQMELTGIDVSFTPQSSSISIRTAVVDDDLPELLELQQKASMSGVGA